MKPWHPRPPQSPRCGDHDVHFLGGNLKEKRIAVLVSGGIAAMKVPLLCRHLRSFGAHVQAYASHEALRFVTREALAWATEKEVIVELTAASEHLSSNRPFDAYLLVPATANSLQKFRHGIADTVISTCLATALGRMEKGLCQILAVPTLHGDMHSSLLQESLEVLSAKGVILIPPRDDYGKHNIPDQEMIGAYVCAALSQSSLKGKKILVTAGPTPAPIDGVRAITNRFRGRLGLQIAEELERRGAQVKVILGAGSVKPASFLNVVKIRNYNEYKEAVLHSLHLENFDFGIFSAAVADYLPSEPVEGKIPSGILKQISLRPADKVIDLVGARYPELSLISFKYQEQMSYEKLIAVARDRLKKGHCAVVANRGEEKGPQGEQVAHLVTEQSVRTLVSKYAIAQGLCDHLETLAVRSQDLHLKSDLKNFFLEPLK